MTDTKPTFGPLALLANFSWDLVSEETYQSMRSALPPAAMDGDAFLYGEPYGHLAENVPLFTVFTSHRRLNPFRLRYYRGSRPITRVEFKVMEIFDVVMPIWRQAASRRLAFAQGSLSNKAKAAVDAYIRAHHKDMAKMLAPAAADAEYREDDGELPVPLGMEPKAPEPPPTPKIPDNGFEIITPPGGRLGTVPGLPATVPTVPCPNCGGHGEVGRGAGRKKFCKLCNGACCIPADRVKTPKLGKEETKMLGLLQDRLGNLSEKLGAMVGRLQNALSRALVDEGQQQWLDWVFDEDTRTWTEPKSARRPPLRTEACPTKPGGKPCCAACAAGRTCESKRVSGQQEAMHKRPANARAAGDWP